jgi:hypothetical protein
MIRWLRKHFDVFDLYFGIFPAAAWCAALLTWQSMIVRGLRREEVREDWRYFVSTAAAMAAYALKSAAQLRQVEAQRAAVIGLREVERDVAEDSKQRDERAAAQQRRLVVIAALTLGVSLIAVVVAVVVATLST